MIININSIDDDAYLGLTSLVDYWDNSGDNYNDWDTYEKWHDDPYYDTRLKIKIPHIKHIANHGIGRVYNPLNPTLANPVKITLNNIEIELLKDVGENALKNKNFLNECTKPQIDAIKRFLSSLRPTMKGHRTTPKRSAVEKMIGRMPKCKLTL